MGAPKVLAGRFSKQRVIRDLIARQTMLRIHHGFDPNDGTRQLIGKNAEDLKKRAIAYGEWQGIEIIIRLIESGDLGYGD